MFFILLFIHCILCVALVTLVLLQQGKGADMGAAFRGGSSTLFGPSGAGSFVGKLTTTLAVLFMFTSILLVKAYEKLPSSLGASEQKLLSGSVMDGEEDRQKQAAGTESSAQPASPGTDGDAVKVPVAPAPQPVK